MRQMSLGKVAVATSTFAVAALLSIGWSEQRGVSLSVESAQARVGRPLTPMSAAGVARRQYRRGAYGAGPMGAGPMGAGPMGAGLAGAAAFGTAAAVAATSPYRGWGTSPYYSSSEHGGGPYARSGGSYVGTGDFAARAYYHYGAGRYADPGFLAARAEYGSGTIETRPFYLPRAYVEDGPWYGYSGWADYKASNGIVCDPGTMVKGPDGLMHICQ